MVTKAEFLFMILILTYHPVHIPSHPVHTAAHCNPLQPAANHSVHIQCTHYSSHYIFSAHCSHVQPCTAICSQPSVHTAANCSHLQPSTLQLFYPVHTAATLSIQCIQCTSGPPQGKPIPLLAYLQSSQQTLMVDCSSP